MYVIMGGTGHVGAATATVLLERGERVTLVTRDAARAAPRAARGAAIAEADVDDVPALRAALRCGRRALLLNPPADPATDTDAVETRTVGHVLEAVDGSGLEKVVAVSTGGARPGERIGDFNTLWALEEGLRRRSIPAAINRGAYYMSNWDGQLPALRDGGRLASLYPAELPIPMVAPRDIGTAAADRLQSGTDDVGVRHVEGPRRYTPADVARAFSRALGIAVEVEEIPRARWHDAFLAQGFSGEAAQSYVRMLAETVDHGFDMPADAIRGRTTLEEHVASLVEGA